MNSCVRSNTNFWGADIRDMRSKNIEECAGRCMAEPQCKSVTFSKSDKNCWLKHKVEGDNGPRDDSTYSSIRADCLIGDDFGELLPLKNPFFVENQIISLNVMCCHSYSECYTELAEIAWSFLLSHQPTDRSECLS